MRQPSLVVVVAVTALAIGCDNVESSMVSTDDMGLFVRAEVSDAGELEVLAQITTDNPALLESTWINLSAGDRLVATLDGEEQRLTEELVFPLGIYQYRTYFDQIAGGERLRVGLERTEYEDALRSRAVLPEPFDLGEVVTQFPVRGGLNLEWTGGGDADQTLVSFSSSCFESTSLERAGNPREIAIRPSEFRYREAADPTAPCPVEIAVYLVNDGFADSAFGRGGNVRASQVRTLDLVAMP